MRNIIFIALFYSGFVFAQGGWNIGYVFSDSISKKHIGWEVKIDFRHEFLEATNIKRTWIRNYVEWQDHATIRLGEKDIDLIEKRTFYVDQGFYQDQYLLISSPPKIRVQERIYASRLLAINNNSFQFEVQIDTFEKNGKDWQKSSKVPQIYTLWIAKNLIDGFMYEI